LNAYAPQAQEPTPDDLVQRLARARVPFAAMVGTYALEVFNDQFLKQTAMLLAIATLGAAWQGYIQVTFMLSFVLLAAPAGWLADCFAKRTVVIGSKALELLAVLIGAAGLLSGNWTIILLGIAIMGLRGTIFGPAMNGSIPELYPDSHVTKANGLLKMFTTAASLLGIAFAGFALDVHGLALGVPKGHAIVAAGIVLVALIGIGVSQWLPRRVAAAPETPFPKRGPWETIDTLLRVRADHLLAVVIAADAYFWFLGALLVQLINKLGLAQFGYSTSLTSCLVIAEVVGVAIGGILSAKLATGPRWHRVLAPAAWGIGGFLLLLIGVPSLPTSLHLDALLLSLALAGIAGGLFLIPLESFIQVRPAPAEKGSIISAANFAAFTGMLLAGPASIFLNRTLLPTVSMALIGGVTLLVGVWLHVQLSKQ
jgi:hypothetical protein